MVTVVPPPVPPCVGDTEVMVGASPSTYVYWVGEVETTASRSNALTSHGLVSGNGKVILSVKYTFRNEAVYFMKHVT